MQYGKGWTSVCNIENGAIKEFDIQVIQAKNSGIITADIYKKLRAFELKPNQYIGYHKSEK